MGVLYSAGRALGGTGDVYATAVGADRCAGLVVAGSFRGSADFGSGTLSAMGTSDAFVAAWRE